MGLYNPYWIRKPKVYVYLFGIGEPVELLFKQGGGKRKT